MGSGKQYAAGSTCPSEMERVEADQGESTILRSGLECYCRKFMVIARLKTTSHENTLSWQCSQVAPTAGGDIFRIASVALIKGLRGTSFALSEFLVVKKFLEKTSHKRTRSIKSVGMQQTWHRGTKHK